MDELAAAAAVLAVDVDDFADDDLEQPSHCGVAAGIDAHAPMEVSTEADKENFTADAAQSQGEDANPEVTPTQENHARQPCVCNLTPPDTHQFLH